MISAAKTSLLCSFCRKPQSAVQKLIASPPESVRAYICDECIAACSAIVKEDVGEEVVESGHPLSEHPRASELFGLLELWIKHESLGQDALADIAQVHSIVDEMLRETIAKS